MKFDSFGREIVVTEVDQAADYVWTGVHEFLGAVSVTETGYSYASIGNLNPAGTYPGFNQFAVGGPADNRRWYSYVDEVSGAYNVALADDAGVVTAVLMSATGSAGAIGAVAWLGNHTFNGNVTIDDVGAGTYAFANGVIHATVANGNAIYLRLTQTSQADWHMGMIASDPDLDFYNGGVVARMRADGFMTNAIGFGNLAQTRYLADNNSIFTYGGQYMYGAVGGYTGLVLYDTVQNPTFMSSGSAFGVYSQGSGYWSWLDTGAGGTFLITLPILGNFQHNSVAASAPGKSGTYTPTGFTGTNVSAVTPTGDAQYMRVGNVVTVSGEVAITVSGAGSAAFGLSLPFASALTGTQEAGGTAGTVAGNNCWAIRADTTNDRVQFSSFNGVSGTLHYSFTYIVV